MQDFARVALRNLCPLALLVGCSSHAPSPPDADAIGHGVPCVGAAPTAGLGAYDSTLIAQLDASSFIFRATVTAVHASTLPGPSDTAKTVVAHIDAAAFTGLEIQELGGTWGTTVTVDLRTANLAVGDSAVFATRVEEYNGGALALSEVTRLDTAAYPRIEADVPRMKQLFAADPLYARIASAAQIVIGGVDRVAEPSPSPGASEHDPQWQLASVHVDHVACGPDVDRVGSVAAGFAGSLDIAWYQAPKLALDQHGVLLLHHPVVEPPFSIDTPELLVLDRLDVHPSSDAAAIEAILATPPPLP
jgi:hypothetical protein